MNTPNPDLPPAREPNPDLPAPGGPNPDLPPVREPGPELPPVREPVPAPPPEREPGPAPPPLSDPIPAPPPERGPDPPAEFPPIFDPNTLPPPSHDPEMRRVGAWRHPLLERPEIEVELDAGRLRSQSRRDFLLLGAGTLVAAIGAWWLLPNGAKARLTGPAARDRLDTLAGRVGLSTDRRERTLDRVLTFDDDVAEALYSKDRRVRTYDRGQVTPLRNNYDGQTPGPEYLPGWRLEVSGLASGANERLSIDELLRRFPLHEQVTRLVCVEGWSAIAWWGGIRFAEFLQAYPPAPGMRFAALRSGVNLDGSGRPDPYYVSIDLDTARHPQTLLATHHDGRPLELAHGAPLRLLVPMKLGLKNIKAVTSVAYVADPPRDYWNERGYSRYDGI